jgi:hypothetical protein
LIVVQVGFGSEPVVAPWSGGHLRQSLMIPFGVGNSTIFGRWAESSADAVTTMISECIRIDPAEDYRGMLADKERPSEGWISADPAIEVEF